MNKHNIHCIHFKCSFEEVEVKVKGRPSLHEFLVSKDTGMEPTRKVSYQRVSSEMTTEEVIIENFQKMEHLATVRASSSTEALRIAQERERRLIIFSLVSRKTLASKSKKEIKKCG